MRFRGYTAAVIVFVIATLSLSGCNESDVLVASGVNPVPTITALSPSSATAGGVAFTLTVDGSNFIPGSMVMWNGNDRPRTFVSSTRLEAVIPAADITTTGTGQVTVVNPAPGGGTSNIGVFNINNPLPAIVSVSPVRALAGSSGFTLTVDGSGFVSGSVVQWNGGNRATTFVSSMQLTAAIPASDIVLGGVAQVTVANPAPGGWTSNAVPFSVVPGVLARVSVASDGTQGDDLSGDFFLPNASGGLKGISISADGSLVAFQSFATNLVASDTNAGVEDIFMRNTCMGAPAGCTPSTILVSRASDGSQGGFFSMEPAISGNGRFVAFRSFATDLVPGDTNLDDDIFVHDTCLGASLGCTPSTIRVSVASDGTQAECLPLQFVGDQCGQVPSISGDGRVVAFQSIAGNLVSGDTNNSPDVFVRDTCIAASAGCVPSTMEVGGRNPAISPDGRFLALDGGTVFGAVFLVDTCLGAPLGCLPSAIAGSQSPGFGASVSAGGRFVAFASSADSLVPGDTNGVDDIFVRDTCLGAPAGCVPQTMLVSVGTDGNATNGLSRRASISGDGRFVAFESLASNLVMGDTNGTMDIFVRDTCLGVLVGCTPSTVRISVASDGTQGNGESSGPLISADGHFVAFASAATNLIPADTNGTQDVFLANTGF